MISICISNPGECRAEGAQPAAHNRWLWRWATLPVEPELQAAEPQASQQEDHAYVAVTTSQSPGHPGHIAGVLDVQAMAQMMAAAQQRSLFWGRYYHVGH